MSIYTVGHSTRTLEFLISLLQGYNVHRLVDVRTIPRSRYNPQFNRDTVPEMLRLVGIHYTHMPGLGGLRKPLKDSINTGWKHPGFRAYADYMQTAPFEKYLDELIQRGKKETQAVMCAEAVPWRCHRSLLADALTVRGVEVYDIMSRVSAPRHELTPWAKRDGKRLFYPSPQMELKGIT